MMLIVFEFESHWITPCWREFINFKFIQYIFDSHLSRIVFCDNMRTGSELHNNKAHHPRGHSQWQNSTFDTGFNLCDEYDGWKKFKCHSIAANPQKRNTHRRVETWGLNESWNRRERSRMLTWKQWAALVWRRPGREQESWRLFVEGEIWHGRMVSKHGCASNAMCSHLLFHISFGRGRLSFAIKSYFKNTKGKDNIKCVILSVSVSF